MSVSLSGLGTRRRRRLPLLPILSIALLLAAIGLLITELIAFSQEDEQLPSALSVAGVSVGGLLPFEARARWEQVYSKPVVLYYDASPILLEPASVGFRINENTMLAGARSSEETETSFWLRFFNHLTRQDVSDQSVEIPLAAEYQQNLLDQFLRDIATRYDRPPGKAGYDLQTLTIFPGLEGFVLDIGAAIQSIDEALKRPDNRTVILPIQKMDSATPTIDALQELIVSYLDAEGFIYDGQTTVASVFVLDLVTGEEINLLGDVAFSAASTMKVPILIDYFRNLAFAPTQEEAWLMANSLLCSNNSSSNLIMQIIGQNDLFAGIEDVTNTAQYLGARNTYLSAPFDLGIEGQQLGSIPAPTTSNNPNFNTGPDPFNQTTTEDLGTLFSLIYDCANLGSGLMTAYPDGEFNQTECKQMLNLMSANDLLRLLQGGIPPDVIISHKNGWVADMVGDAGIVFPANGRDYVIAVFLWEDTEFQNFERLWPLVEGISRAAWNFFSPQEALLSPREDIPFTAQVCEGNYLPPFEQLDLNDINGWRS